MQRFGVIADIHSNEEALEAALRWLKKEGVDGIVCLGDIVGYNASPSRCIELVRSSCRYVIGGNHDRMVAGERKLFGRKTREGVDDAIQWQRKAITKDQLAYLRDLPDEVIVEGRYLAAHGSPRDRDEYILSRESARENLKHMAKAYPGIKICFYGHSHAGSVIFDHTITSRVRQTTSFEINPAKIYLVNPGSVGQPRDKCPMAAFALFDAAELKLTLYRIPYDVRKAQARVVAAGLPQSFADRLALGK